MLQEYVKKHVAPPMQFNRYAQDDTATAVVNRSPEPFTCSDYVIIPSGNIAIWHTMVDDYRSSAVPLAVSVGASGTIADAYNAEKGSTMIIAFAQYRPRETPTPDRNQPIMLFPVSVSGVGRTFSAEDVFSVLPPADPTKVLVVGLMVRSFGTSTTALGSVRAIFKDGPVYQPNK